MEKPVEIEILGHKAKIMSVRGHLADGIWYKEDSFAVQIDCDEPIGSTIGFFVELPIQNYGGQEFIQAVKKAAEKKIPEMIAERDNAHEEREVKKRRQADLDSIASQIETIIQEGRLM
ncbi:hypothetical protein LCGC14_0654790 [marine sediment metagenome]|uniref:Uncharacterized protein n=1 Tax=marine sediment metagenome TaxID=412755 RepID=A0A0F9RF36_9ZZZZ